MMRIMLSKSKLREHWKILVIGVLILASSSSAMAGLAYAEGAFTDPQGQLNNPLTLTCHQGVLSDRTIPVSDDGEYNWMFARGQQVNITLVNPTTTEMTIYWVQWSKVKFGILDQQTLVNGTLHLQYIIQAPGHYQFEIAGNGIQVPLQIYATASSTNSALWNCVNIGDLFRSD